MTASGPDRTIFCNWLIWQHVLRDLTLQKSSYFSNILTCTNADMPIATMTLVNLRYIFFQILCLVLQIENTDAAAATRLAAM